MLSLVERGKTSPSIGTLVAISSALGAHVQDLFDHGGDDISERVQRASEQSRYVAADGTSRRILRSDARRGIELSLNEYGPGCSSAREPSHHEGYEYGVVLAGAICVEIEGKEHKLGVGDSIAYKSGLQHRIVNKGDANATTIWVNVER